MQNALLISKFANNMKIPLIASKHKENTFENTNKTLLDYRNEVNNPNINHN